ARRRRGEGDPDYSRGPRAQPGAARPLIGLTTRFFQEESQMTTKCSAAALCVLLAAGSAGAQYSAGGIKVGILTDMNGVYSAISGPGSQKAAEMAADDFMKANKEFAGKVTVIAVDHQNKAD